MAEDKEIRVEITGDNEDKKVNTADTENDQDPSEVANDISTENKSVEESEEPVSEDTVDTEQQPAEEVESPLSAADQLENQVAEVTDKLLRVMADFDNYKKRTSRQYEDRISSANDRLLTEFLEIIDNFERAEEAGNGATDLDAFREGMRLIFNQMTDLLAKYNVTPIESLGKPFDPNLHEAMMQVDTDEYEEGVVALEISKGYKIGNRVLRHSRVGVAAAKKQEQIENTEKTESQENNEQAKDE